MLVVAKTKAEYLLFSCALSEANLASLELQQTLTESFPL